jgi:hypothetical protein
MSSVVHKIALGVILLAPVCLLSACPAPGQPTSTGKPQDIAPVLAPIGDKTAYQDELLTFSISASDADSPRLTYLADGLPEGAVFDPATLTFSWTPAVPGTYEVTFSVSDGSSDAPQEVLITVYPGRPLRLNLIYYGEHNPVQDALIINVRPQYLISNTAHGFWGEYYHHQTDWLLQDAAPYHTAGIRVIGYITAGYEAKGSGSGINPSWYTLEMNRKLIQSMAELDKVDGVFIDECSAFPDAAGKEYLKELTSLVHSYGLIAWGNVGQADFDAWFFTDGGFDFMHSTEQWKGQQLNAVQKQYAGRVSVTGFQAGYSLQDAVRLTEDAWEKGLAFCYIGTGDYDTLPSWLEDYAAALRGSGRLTTP